MSYRIVQTKIWAPLIVLISILQGCSNVYYTPNQPNIPVLRNKNDFELRTAYSGEAFGDVEALEAQIAYSPLKYWSVNFNSAYFFSDQSHINRGSGKLLEAGTGVYYPITKNVYVSCNVDYSQTNVNLYFDRRIKSDYSIQRWSLTPGFQFGNDYVNVFGGIRFSKLQFTDGLISINTPETEKAELEYILRKPDFNIMETTIGIKAGYKFIFLGFQVTRCFSSELNYNGRNIYSPSMTSLTLSINQQIFRSTKKKKKLK